jgi:hypothetical protein
MRAAMIRVTLVQPLLSLVLSLSIVACGQAPAPQEASAGGRAAAPAADRKAAVKTASLPGDACGWIPAPDVEQIVGKLEGAPTARGRDCVYPLAEKSQAFATLLEMRKRLRGGDAGDHDFYDEVKVSVDLSGENVTGELALGAVSKMFSRELGQGEPPKKDPPPAGWDWVGTIPYGWVGRVGHVAITVVSPPEIEDDTKIALAARVRDRIPDLPFPAENTYQVPTFAADRDPCTLLTRAEAEAVLGPLVIDPYRSIEDSPHAYAAGKACAYFASGHRTFVVTPEWSDGKMQFGMSSGIGGLVGMVAPLDRAPLEGPWDKGQVDGPTGALLLLRGDRLLRIDYLTSSTDRAGALKLAAQAMPRLSS